MKKKNEFLKMMLAIILLIVFLFLIYKVWNVFGVWNIILTCLVTVASSLLLNSIGSRKELDKEILYNPKEWPKYLNVFIIIGIGYYLNTLIDVKTTTGSDYYFGIAFLIVFVGVQIAYSAYIITYNRKDFIRISDSSVKYKDNQEVKEFQLDKIAGVEKIKRDIKLTFLNNEVHTIETSKMNFNAKDLSNVITDIKNKLKN